MILVRRNSKLAVYSLASAAAVAMPILVPLSMQIHYSHFQNELKEAIDHAASKKSAAIVSLYRPIPIAQFYLKREVPVIETPEQLEVLARKHRGKRIFMLSQAPYGEALNEHFTYYEAMQGRRWILYAVKWKQIMPAPIARAL